MLEKIEQARKALESKCYQPTLALVLAMIEMCALVEYPNSKDKNGNLKYSFYKKWFDNFIYSKNKDLLTFNGFSFKGKDCYKIRCSFLHGGYLESISKGNDCNKFSFIFSQEMASCYGKIKYGEIRKSFIRINISDFCNLILDSIEKYYNNRQNKEDFEQFNNVITKPITN